MIAITKKFNHDLRKKEAMEAVSLLPSVRSATIDLSGCNIFSERGRFYIISTFKCNASCDFCSFYKIEIDESSFTEIDEQIKYGFSIPSPLDGYSIAITGGEPLIKKKRLHYILSSLKPFRDQIRWIGFGTNGSLKIPDFIFNEFSCFNLRFYISRHHYLKEKQEEIFNHRCLDTKDLIDTLTGYPHITCGLSCNLIRGQIDRLDEIKKYVLWAKSIGVKKITMRELNEVAEETKTYGEDPEIKRYLKYYDDYLVDMNSILEEVEKDSEFEFVEQNVRPFLYHEIWKFDGIKVMFRRVSEATLINNNRKKPDEIDELVLWPDARLSGCWDHEMKVLRDPS